MAKQRKTRVERLAEALQATILEDQGYRAILYNKDKGQMRYHITHGLHRVTRVGKQWRVVEELMTTSAIDALLLDLHLAPPPGKSIVKLLAEHLDADIKDTFAGGGGIVYVSRDDVYVRYHPIGGLDIVELSLTKWVRKERIMWTTQVVPLVREGKWKDIKDGYHRAVDKYHAVQRGGAAEGNAATPPAKAEEGRVPEEAERVDEDRSAGSTEDHRQAEGVQSV